MNTQGGVWARWRRRRSTPFKRALAVLVFLVGFALYWVLLPEWTERTRPWEVDNFRPAYFFVLSAIYWSLAVVVWGLLYPGDGQRPRPTRRPREDAAQPQV